jgi:hypothetical protein
VNYEKDPKIEKLLSTISNYGFLGNSYRRENKVVGFVIHSFVTYRDTITKMSTKPFVFSEVLERMQNTSELEVTDRILRLLFKDFLPHLDLQERENLNTKEMIPILHSALQRIPHIRVERMSQGICVIYVGDKNAHVMPSLYFCYTTVIEAFRRFGIYYVNYIFETSWRFVRQYENKYRSTSSN